VILGTAALRDPDLVASACDKYPGRIAVGIDARGGRVAVQGWSEQSDMPALDLARRFEDVGVAAIVFTDIGRDGLLAGPNTEATIELARAVSLPVILSGGVSSLADLAAIKAAGEGILAGVVCGRAIYDGRIDVAQAVALLEGQSDPEEAARC
jgi:phosphoribosylformimino-5-aminoimidazole carboxamide ribotide isomerase